jgi:hypothetical protein
MSDDTIRPETDGDYQASRWEILDDENASWAMRKIAAAQQAIGRIDRVAEAEYQHVSEWRAREIATHESTIAFFESRLYAYASEQRERYDRKTVSTPWGSIRSRTRPARLSVSDRDAFVEWARVHHPDLVEVQYRPNSAKFGEAFRVENEGGAIMTHDGEPVPGVEWFGGGIIYRVDAGPVGDGLVDDEYNNEEG